MVAVSRTDGQHSERYAVGGMTCGACVRHVQKALGAVPGVVTARVEIATGTAVVERDPAVATVERLIAAVAAAGYELRPAGDGDLEATPRVPLIRPAIFGVLAAAALFTLYLGVVTVAQGWEHTTSLLAEDAGFVVPLMLGFGTQVGLYSYLRALHASVASGGMAASTGTSSAAMLACCAHHLVDVLPVVGLSGAALFLGAYKSQLLWLGLAMNLAGVTYLLWQLQRWRTRACCTA